MVNSLVRSVGPTLVALIANETRDRKDPIAWAAGDSAPTDEQTVRLRVLDELIDLVSKAEGPDVARTWLVGMDIGGGMLSPVEAIRVDRFKEARASAERLIGVGS